MTIGPARNSTKATVALVLEILSCVISPGLYFGGIVSLLVVATVSSEAANPPSVTLIAVLVFLAFAVSSFALPAIALILAGSAKRQIAGSSGSLNGTVQVLIARVIGWVIMGLLVAGQVFVILWMVGLCSLDGCQSR